MRRIKWNRKQFVMWIAILLVGVTLVAGTVLIQQRKAVQETEPDLVIYSPHPLDFISTLVEEFEAQSGIRVEVVNESSGELLTRLEEEKEQPVCDVLWGGSLFTVQSYTALFEDYQSVNEPYVQEEFRNTEGSLTRFTDIPSVIMVNTDLLGDIQIEGYADLLNPELKGKIAYSNPSGSSSAFEHLTNMLYAMGEGDPESGWAYVEQLCENLDGKLLEGSAAVYKGVAAGDYVAGLTFEEGAASYVADGAPIGIVYMEEGVISTPDGLYIVKGARHEAAAQAFVDFATGYDAQQMIATHLNRRSVREDVFAPSYLPAKEDIHIISADAAEVAEKKQQWLEHFAKILEQAKETGEENALRSEQ
jgi:iron(III) transport system substrate-binding protein